MNHYRSTRAEISKKALQNNYAWLKKQCSTGDILPIIKANAYGHNAEFVAKHLEQHTKMFAVALLEEAIALRHANIQSPIVILEGVYDKSALNVCTDGDFIPVLHCHEQVSLYAELEQARRPECWVKVDLGMNRLGFNENELLSVWHKVKPLAPLLPVLIGHFSCADSLNSPTTLHQLDRFLRLKQSLGCKASLANSPAVINWQQSQTEWNRVGIGLYGVSASDFSQRCDELIPVMSLKAPILSIRTVQKGETVGYGASWQASQTSTIATIAIGYADGYPRHASNGAPVWVKDKVVPVVGKVSMDMIMIDISDCSNLVIGDEVELWGKHLAVEKVAEFCQTIAYELVTRVSARVPRVLI
jgi:alanine racemase